MGTRIHALAGIAVALAATFGSTLPAGAASPQSAQAPAAPCATVATNLLGAQFTTTAVCTVVVNTNVVRDGVTAGALVITVTSTGNGQNCSNPGNAATTAITYTDAFGGWSTSFNGMNWEGPFPFGSLLTACVAGYGSPAGVAAAGITGTGAYSGMDQLCGLQVQAVYAMSPGSADYGLAGFSIDNQGGIVPCTRSTS